MFFGVYDYFMGRGSGDNQQRATGLRSIPRRLSRSKKTKPELDRFGDPVEPVESVTLSVSSPNLRVAALKIDKKGTDFEEHYAEHRYDRIPERSRAERRRRAEAAWSSGEELPDEEWALEMANIDARRAILNDPYDEISADELPAIPVGFVTVLKPTEPWPDDTQVWYKEGEAWVDGEDNNHIVSLADVTALDPSFEERRKNIIVAFLRGERNFDYDGLSPLGSHCLKQLVTRLQASNSDQWDLSYADLRGADLSNVDLRGANLEGADLGGARLIHTNLRGANLKGATIKGADLSYADLRDSLLMGPFHNHHIRRWQPPIDFTDVKLKGAKVKDASISPGSKPADGHKGCFSVRGPIEFGSARSPVNGSMMGD